MNMLYTVLPFAATIGLLALGLALTAREFKRLRRRDRRYIARFRNGHATRTVAETGRFALQKAPAPTRTPRSVR